MNEKNYISDWFFLFFVTLLLRQDNRVLSKMHIEYYAPYVTEGDEAYRPGS